MRWLIVLAACGTPAAPPATTPAAPPATSDYTAICKAVAGDIERLTRQYPQLGEYRAVDALRHDCWIDFGWHTHQATHAGGWTAGVPNPDPDGVWFHVGLWDPATGGNQIDTQPMLPNWWIGDRRVTFLILEGERTTSVAKELLAILTRHGLVTK